MPPFDYEDMWDDAAMVVDELEEENDATVCSVGGGGLHCDLMRGLERRGWGDMKVLALETKGADSLH